MQSAALPREPAPVRRPGCGTTAHGHAQWQWVMLLASTPMMAITSGKMFHFTMPHNHNHYIKVPSIASKVSLTSRLPQRHVDHDHWSKSRIKASSSGSILRRFPGWRMSSTLYRLRSLSNSAAVDGGGAGSLSTRFRVSSNRAVAVAACCKPVHNSTARCCSHIRSSVHPPPNPPKPHPCAHCVSPPFLRRSARRPASSTSTSSTSHARKAGPLTGPRPRARAGTRSRT